MVIFQEKIQYKKIVKVLFYVEKTAKDLVVTKKEQQNECESQKYWIGFNKNKLRVFKQEMEPQSFKGQNQQLYQNLFQTQLNQKNKDQSFQICFELLQQNTRRNQ
ncbi:unnamed protein product [Paramecium sonneborni]|uniref:Uncharacterized protein n=1 Tax=Paramecium sonneborni TaxID=65129 RepID=A0A8S1PA44_9CILI|nr:unnamed protein product [Paramecium sonneborni]